MQNGISCRCYKIKFMENREFIPNATNLWQTEKKSPPLTASTVSSAETHKMFRNMLPNHRKRTEFFSNLPIYAKKHRNIHSNSDRITKKIVTIITRDISYSLYIWIANYAGWVRCVYIFNKTQVVWLVRCIVEASNKHTVASDATMSFDTQPCYHQHSIIFFVNLSYINSTQQHNNHCHHRHQFATQLREKLAFLLCLVGEKNNARIVA